jgi:uncharacterized protein (DUF488 family)
MAGMNVPGSDDRAARRKEANAGALAAFGAKHLKGSASSLSRVVREGGAATVYSIGYERRTGDELVNALHDAGVEYLADVRDKAVSRRPEFGGRAVQALCERAGIEYEPWPELGAPQEQRDALHQTGDFNRFLRVFRSHAQATMGQPLERLAAIVRERRVALLCYERAHEECHRSIIAELLADRAGAGIAAIL